MACGRCGLSLSEFWIAEFWEIDAVICGWSENLAESEKREWQRVSLLGAWVLNIVAKKGKKIEPEQLVPGAWEKKKPPRPLSLEERERIFAKQDAWMKRKMGSNGTESA